MQTAQFILPGIATLALGTALLVPLRDDRRGKRATLADGGTPLRPDFGALLAAPQTGGPSNLETPAEGGTLGDAVANTDAAREGAELGSLESGVPPSLQGTEPAPINSHSTTRHAEAKVADAEREPTAVQRGYAHSERAATDAKNGTAHCDLGPTGARYGSAQAESGRMDTECARAGGESATERGDRGSAHILTGPTHIPHGPSVSEYTTSEAVAFPAASHAGIAADLAERTGPRDGTVAHSSNVRPLDAENGAEKETSATARHKRGDFTGFIRFFDLRAPRERESTHSSDGGTPGLALPSRPARSKFAASIRRFVKRIAEGANLSEPSGSRERQQPSVSVARSGTDTVGADTVMERSFASELALLMPPPGAPEPPARAFEPSAPTHASSREDNAPLVLPKAAALPVRVLPLTRLPLRTQVDTVSWPALLGTTPEVQSRADRHAVLTALIGAPDASSQAALIQAYEEEDTQGRVLALRALMRAGSPEAHGTFLEALRCGSDEERSLAVDALMIVGDRTGITPAFADRIDAIAAKAALAYVGMTTAGEFREALAPHADAARIEVLLDLLAGIIE